MANSSSHAPISVIYLEKESFEAKYSFSETLQQMTVEKFGLCQDGILTLLLTPLRNQNQCSWTIHGNVEVTLPDLWKILIYDSMWVGAGSGYEI